MTKMKRSEFKNLVKECVRECLREIMQEQLVFPQQLQIREAAAMNAPFFNPMDDAQMRQRQEFLSQAPRQKQSNMIQQQLQKQTAVHGRQQLLGGQVNEQASPSSYDTDSATGYIHPLDRLKHAAAPRKTFDPSLDVPVNGQQRQRHANEVMQRFDPSLDAPAPAMHMKSIDPALMKSIFDETARTTFAEQASYGHVQPGSYGNDMSNGGTVAPPADKYAAVVAQSNPEDLFPGAKNWGALAFSNK